VKTLLVDFDGVLRAWPPSVDHAIEERFQLPLGSIYAAAFADERLLPAITGLISDAEWRAAVADALRTAHPGRDADAAVRAWSRSPGQICAEPIDLIRRCRGRARVVLATNATSRLEDDLRALGIEDVFDVIANSSRIGCAKPDREFYRAALSLAGASSGDALIVDDKAANIDAAAQLGIAGHVYRSDRGLMETLAGWGLVASRGESTP